MAQSTAGSAPGSRDDVRRGLLAGLTPLIRLVVLFAIALALPTVARLALGAQGFATQQEVEVIALAAMLLVAAIVYAASLVGVFRRMRSWRESGHTTQATAALWTLAATALIVALPVVLAALWPQHPAP
ncbi:MAG TPA: hypothetical protein VF116_23005 [Ktedonobacterales bacterium]